MKRGEFFRELLKGTGLYSKTGIFWLSLIFLIVGSLFSLSRFRDLRKASADIFGFSQTSGKSIDILKNGEIKVEGKLDKENRVEQGEKFDELRMVVLDNEFQYYDSYQVAVLLPKPLPASGQAPLPSVIGVHGVASKRAYFQNSQTVIFEAQGVEPYATVTIVLPLPKGVIDFSLLEKIEAEVSQLPGLIWLIFSIFFPVFALGYLFFMYRKRKASDFGGKAEGEVSSLPSNLSSAAVGVLPDGKVGAREIVALLLELAQKGVIEIFHEEEGFFLIKKNFTKEKLATLKPYEKILLDKLFLPEKAASSVEDIEKRLGRHIFSRKIAEVYRGIYQEATALGFFLEDPASVHRKFRLTGMGLLLLGVLGFLFGVLSSAEPKYGLISWGGEMMAALVVIYFAKFMPLRTAKSREELVKWLQFRNFLKAPRPLPAELAGQATYEKYLPYAIVLGVEGEWTHRFRHLSFARPVWFDTTLPFAGIEGFTENLFPFISWLGKELALSHEPSVD